MQLTTPFPHAHIPMLMEWLHEYPESNFDDTGARTLDGLRDAIRYREDSGEILWEVIQSGQPVGIIAYKQLFREQGMFRGICFTREMHGTGVPLRAVRKVLSMVFDGDTQKVAAIHFEDNFRVAAFLKKLGAVSREHSLSPTVRNGKPLHWKAVEIAKDDFLRSLDRSASNQEHSGPPKGIQTPA